jgi:hypothetical protein
LDVVGICGTSLVAVNLLRRAFVLRFKLKLDVRSCFFICLFAWKAKQNGDSLAYTLLVVLNSISNKGILRKIPEMKNSPPNCLNQNANGTI